MLILDMYFNPILVRFKHEELLNSLNSAFKFQSYFSPIQTEMPLLCPLCDLYFNPILVRFKQSSNPYHCKTEKFQSYFSLIQT